MVAPSTTKSSPKPLIEWDERLILGVASIDAQHRKLVDLANELYDAMRVGKGKEKVDSTLNGLVAYTKSHFAFEEELFAKHEYADREAHTKEHKALLEQVVRFITDAQKSSTGLPVKLMDFIESWLKNHIQKDDKAYVPYLTSKGVK